MKYLSVILVLCLTLGLAGCSGGEEGETTPTTTTTTGTTAPAYPFTGYINATTLNVRPAADATGIPIGGLVFGDAVTVTGREGDWYAIAFGEGVGYVNAQYVQDTVPVSTEATTTTEAETTGTTAATDTTVDTTGTTTTVIIP